MSNNQTLLRKIMAILKPETEQDNTPFLLIGLGNPGREYQQNRHNVGFLTLNRLAERLGVAFTRFENRALVTKGDCSGKRVILAKPQTFMNLSGRAVAPLARFYKVPLSNLLVVYDDVDLSFGTIRMRPSGGSSGQKGMASIIESLGRQEFPRLRIGIDRPPGQMDAAAYVLQDFTINEFEDLPEILQRASDAILMYVEDGIEMAMTKFNGTNLL